MQVKKIFNLSSTVPTISLIKFWEGTEEIKIPHLNEGLIFDDVSSTWKLYLLALEIVYLNSIKISALNSRGQEFKYLFALESDQIFPCARDYEATVHIFNDDGF